MDLSDLQSNTRKAERLLKALANRHRLMILCELYGGERSVTALNEKLPLSRSALSQHLARLRSDGLVKIRRDSRSIFYTLEGMTAGKVIATLAEIHRPTARE